MTPDRMEFPLLTAAEVGAMLGGIPAKTVLQYAREGRLPSIEVGRHRRFNRPCVERVALEAATRGRAV
jgi:excisionase family DNA binding protein